MRSLQPTFQQRSYKISQRQKVFTHISCFTNDLMSIARRGQFVIAIPTICAHFAFWLHALFNCWHQTVSRSILNFMQAYPSRTFASIFNRYNHQSLAFSASAALSRTFTPYVSFINLNGTDQTISARSDHGDPQFMQHRPSCFIPTEPENSLKPKGADAVFLADDLPHSPKPHLQRYPTVLEYRSGSNRNTTFATPAAIPFYARGPKLIMTAVGTFNSIWPSHLIKIFSARFFRCKVFFKFKHRFRIVFHNPVYYILRLRQSNG